MKNNVFEPGDTVRPIGSTGVEWTIHASSLKLNHFLANVVVPGAGCVAMYTSFLELVPPKSFLASDVHFGDVIELGSGEKFAVNADYVPARFRDSPVLRVWRGENESGDLRLIYRCMEDRDGAHR